MAFLNIAPTGTVLPFAGSTAPEGWLICDGSSQSTTTYAKLFAVIAYTYGGTGGSFNVPDMRGVFPRGAGTNSIANYGGVTGHTPAGGSLASKGGQKTAKNGLSATNGTSTVTALTLQSSSVSGSATSGGIDHTHGSQAALGSPTLVGSGGTAMLLTAAGTNTGTASAFNHTHSLSATASAQALTSGTVAAQTSTVASTDTETTPAFLALNYIIKL